MKVKIFMDTKTDVIEERINTWLDDLGSATIIKMETVLTATAEKPSDGAHPCIVVTVWPDCRSADNSFDEIASLTTRSVRCDLWV